MRCLCSWLHGFMAQGFMVYHGFKENVLSAWQSREAVDSRPGIPICGEEFWGPYSLCCRVKIRLYIYKASVTKTKKR